MYYKLIFYDTKFSIEISNEIVEPFKSSPDFAESQTKSVYPIRSSLASTSPSFDFGFSNETLEPSSFIEKKRFFLSA